MTDLRHSSRRASSVEARVLDLIAEMSGLERGDIEEPSRLLDARLDSLTSIAIVTRIEAAFGIVADEVVFELLVAREFGELGRLIARIVAEQRRKPAKRQETKAAAAPAARSNASERLAGRRGAEPLKEEVT